MIGNDNNQSRSAAVWSAAQDQQHDAGRDQKNAGDPAYDPPERMSYDNYRQQRSLSLEEDGQGQEQ